jgi:archaemetzincin
VEGFPEVSEISLVPVGAVGHDLLAYLSVVLPDLFGVPCRVRACALDPAEAFDRRRRQYHSTRLLAKLKEVEARGRVLGVADVDLFVPILTFVFGEAQLGGRAALFSARRLRQEFYGLPADERLLRERCEKEAAHELGHAHGLAHCPSYDCVMHFSNSVEQVDLKAGLFCAACDARLLSGGRDIVVA